jgi:penicillin-insensitive murein endopeptidase
VPKLIYFSSFTPKYLLIIALFSSPISAEESICYGTTSDGRLVNGVQLPASGKNYTGYSAIARIAGRTYVHSTVESIIVSAYKDLEKEQPEKMFKYAETGFQDGGQFRPHKTHRNGLSVDFMTPVINPKGKSVHLPTNLLNKLGYNIEFDDNDKYNNLSIDYDALAAHITFLHKQSIKHGHNIWRVIFDPKLQSHLFNTQYADYLKKNILFSKKRSWVRHDEHYHVDFSIACKQ